MRPFTIEYFITLLTVLAVSFTRRLTYSQSTDRVRSRELQLDTSAGVRLSISPGDDALSFHVMTYNVRIDSAKDGPVQWKFRKDSVIRLIQYYQPDLIGFQEVLPNQLADLHSAFPSFGWYGVGRDDTKPKDEFDTIFYRLDRFELLDEGTFWLSETPDVPGSIGWDAYLPYICSWVKLRDRWINRNLYHFNTHLAATGSVARPKGAGLILFRIHHITEQGTPVILTGDFNSRPVSSAYRTVIADPFFQDTKYLAKAPHLGPDGTATAFDVRRGVTKLLDYIFVSSQYFIVLQHAHLNYSENMLYPSDHLPVLAKLTYKK